VAQVLDESKGSQPAVAVEEAVRRRRLNQGRARLFGTVPERQIVFLCECGDEACRQSVLLTAGDFTGYTGRGEPVLSKVHTPGRP
jgi:hypothetical protein